MIECLDLQVYYAVSFTFLLKEVELIRAHKLDLITDKDISKTNECSSENSCCRIAEAGSQHERC